MTSIIEHSAPPAKAKVMREKILALEEYLRQFDDQSIGQIFHHFSKGIYAREMRIPAGTVLTGKIHKYENLNILVKGTISVVTEEGQKLLQAPQIIVSPAGTKRAGYAIEDTIWITVHASEERNLEKLENELIVKSFDELPEKMEEKS